jgi:hypothetical protein
MCDTTCDCAAQTAAKRLRALSMSSLRYEELELELVVVEVVGVGDGTHCIDSDHCVES